MSSTNDEQYLLELVNDARLNPLGDAARYLTSYDPLTATREDIQGAIDAFHVSGPALRQDYAALTAAQPLAWNDGLAAASRQHDGAMIAAGVQSHQVAGEQDFVSRDRTAGYVMQAGGENVFAYATDVLQAHAAFMIDWGNAEPGHRTNIMDPVFREAGIGITAGGNGLGSQVVTEDFGTRSTAGSFVLGVAYADRDGNGFYSVGEGVEGLDVVVGGVSTRSSSSGGYALQTGAMGAQTVTMSGAGLNGSVSVGIDLGSGSNVKLDVVNGTTLRTSTSATVSGPVSRIEGLGVAGLAITAGDGSQAVIGTSGNDALRGGTGNDEVRGALGDDSVYGGQGSDFVFGGQGNDEVRGGLDNDEVRGGQGNDQLYGGQGDDRLYAGLGDDILTGGLGNDTMTGGLGANRYVFGAGSGHDTILGFNAAGGDRLVLGGQGFTIGAASDGSALLSLSGGGTIDLAGIQPGQLSGNIVA